MFSTAAIVESGASGCSVYAHAPSSPRSSEFHAANRTLRFGRRPVLRRQRVGLGDLDQRHHARAVVVGAVEDLRGVGAVVVVVRGDDHPFVLQPRIAALRAARRRCDRARCGDRPRCGASTRAPAAAAAVKPRAVSADFAQLVERLAGAGDQRRRDRRRDLRDRNVDAIRPRRERVVENPRRLLRPVVARRRLEVRRARMIVHVADEQHRRPRPSPAPPAPCATTVDDSDVTTPSNGLFGSRSPGSWSSASTILPFTSPL